MFQQILTQTTDTYQEHLNRKILNIVYLLKQNVTDSWECNCYYANGWQFASSTSSLVYPAKSYSFTLSIEYHAVSVYYNDYHYLLSDKKNYRSSLTLNSWSMRSHRVCKQLIGFGLITSIVVTVRSSNNQPAKIDFTHVQTNALGSSAMCSASLCHYSLCHHGFLLFTGRLFKFSTMIINLIRKLRELILFLKRAEQAWRKRLLWKTIIWLRTVWKWLENYLIGELIDTRVEIKGFNYNIKLAHLNLLTFWIMGRLTKLNLSYAILHRNSFECQFYQSLLTIWNIYFEKCNNKTICSRKNSHVPVLTRLRIALCFDQLNYTWVGWVISF